MARVSVRHVENYQHEAQARTHIIRADEPKDYGADDTAMTPVEMLLSALGTCIGMTIRLYAKKKGWPMPTRYTSELTLETVKAEDCPDCGFEKGPVNLIKAKIEIEGDYDDDQKARLNEIAHRCAVHKVITGQTTVQEVDEI